jgi:glycosyltransferase involved in cell wall biosynthesis
VNTPFVSILIPVRNEAAYIERCLKAVIAQDYPREKIEILIADGMSDDGTREKLLPFLVSYPQISLVDNPENFVAPGLNRLILGSKGEILIRVDGHCVIAKDYVSRCVGHILERGVDGVGGPMRSIGEDLVSEVIALAMSSKFGVGGSAFRTETGKTRLVDTVPFPAYTREIVQKVGLYDEELVRNQDDEYNYRIRKSGGQILLAADVQSEYYTRGTLGKLWRQYFQYGFWKVRVLQKHPRQMSLRQFVPPLFVFAILAAVAAGMFFTWGWIVLLGVVAAYGIAVMVVSWQIARKKGWRFFVGLLLAFATIHISYGVGFWVGLIRFWNRWGDHRGRVPEVRFE